MKRNFFRKNLGCFLLCCAAVVAATSCVKLPRRHKALAEGVSTLQPAAESSARVSLNRATRQELERLPGIGPGLAARIVEHRERHGPFRRAEHLLLVRGISERRFSELRPHVTAE